MLNNFIKILIFNNNNNRWNNGKNQLQVKMSQLKVLKWNQKPRKNYHMLWWSSTHRRKCSSKFQRLNLWFFSQLTQVAPNGTEVLYHNCNETLELNNIMIRVFCCVCVWSFYVFQLWWSIQKWNNFIMNEII